MSRRFLLSFLGTSAISSSSWLLPMADASVPEIDPNGNLFTPKTEMLAGGSNAARGVQVSARRTRRSTLGPSIYETRFVAYLSRFLLNFEPSARAYWNQQGFGFSWSMRVESTDQEDGEDQAAFAAFAESVEVGLADYFSGPYGSYSSVPAAVAGISATQPARSRPPENRNKDQRKQGILNLYSLLKARYSSIAAKRQLAILFSFVSDPDLQPISEIRQLLGETDNVTISAIFLEKSTGGYALDETPDITIEAPPPLGDLYRPARAAPIMKPTSRILRVNVLDGGKGYRSIPTVSIYSFRPIQRQCQVAAIMDRSGGLDSIVVLDPGLGYYDSKSKPLKVTIEAPTGPKGRKARAIVELEYEIAGIELEDGGNGYLATERPSVSIAPPHQLPDWYIDAKIAPNARKISRDAGEAKVVISEMRYPDGTLAFSASDVRQPTSFVLSDDFLNKIARDPLELLPSSVRPELVSKNGKKLYSISRLAAVPQYVAVLAPRYRAYDPVFGGVGRLPVTKGASALTFSEYARLALSGAVCTVVVRTVLNPLELIKTKQQLGNDEDLLRLARMDSAKKERLLSEEAQTTEPEGTNDPAVLTANVGTLDILRTMVRFRGFSSLFQSLDITFLASIPFGSFGFGATELFRRSFTDYFAYGDGAEVVLLLAASAATVVTALAVSPFEVIRVSSMSSLQSKPWTEVLDDYLVSRAFFYLSVSKQVPQGRR